MIDTPVVLLVCVHNAGRSQMAAGFLALLSGGTVEVRSAGSVPTDQVNQVAVAAMAEVGIDITLDDFGMGYSALSYLQRLPVQTLKIDRSFVNGLENAGNLEIVRAILALASGLAMNVTAEGVETEDQLARLKDLSCEFGQGFYFDKPLTHDRAREVLRKHKDSILGRCVA